MSYKNKKKKQVTQTKTSFINLVPIIIVLALVPLIVRLKIITFPTENLNWYPDATKTLGDLFVYYKSKLIVLAGIISVCIIAYQMLNKKFKFNNYKSFYLLYTYLGFVMLSYMFTSNLFFSTTGYIEHYENVFVLISYVLIFMYTAISLKTEKEFETLIYFWMGSIAILFIIGLTQFLGHDFFYTKLGRILILPPEYVNKEEVLQARGYGENLIYQSLFHYNYVSFYASLALPFFTVLLLVDKKKIHRLIYALIVGIMAFNLVGSGSRNGVMGIAVALLFIILVLRKIILANWKSVSAITIVCIVLLVVGNAATGNVMMSKFTSLFSEMGQTIDYPLNGIYTYEDKSVIDYDDAYLEVRYEPGKSYTQFSFYDKEGTLLEYTKFDKVFKFTAKDEPLDKYKHITYTYASYQDNYVAKMTIDGTDWNLAYVDDGFAYLAPYGKYEQLVEVPAVGFEGKERFGSERGYIWSRSIPLLKEHFLLGSGPDTFAITFPQDDYVGKYNAYNTQKMIVDKPHNIFLGYGINTGVPSLLALLIFWIIYIVWSLKLYFKSDFSSFYAKIGVASLVAVIGYLSSGIFNDTNTNITPVFWAILGIGFAANLRYKKEI